MKLTHVAALGALLVYAAAFAADRPAPTTPNFMVINIDDLGYGDIVPFASKINRTPHLDRMAKEGMRLTSLDHPRIVEQIEALVEAMKDDLGLDGVGRGVRELG
jgi:hypothetical protein